ncbi:glycosyltransferase [Aneurinibacillus terranovensis]|uniref:glycosyltransferase n=1 Tax=Aneurinibacillus terranovensis TaxID=278991 RepID=UPI0004030082|nr:glycosyltransferase [Aneurinibacillus terranovensis]
MKYDFKLNMEVDDSHSLIIKKIKPGSVVLEFGPANGKMTKYLSEHLSCKVYIVELDEIAGKQAANYAQDYLIGNIEDYEWIDKYRHLMFDYIIFADVLEHLNNPQKVLKTATRFLKEEGSVLVSLPNIAHNSIIIDLINNKFEYKQTGLLDSTHVRFFTYSSAVELLDFANLVPVTQMVTYTRVGQNEFNNSYADIPNSLAMELKKKKYGEVYQFVFEAKKKLNVDDFLRIEEISKKVLPQYQMQLYVDQGGDGYKEEVSIIREFVGKENIIEFDLTQFSKIKSMRFDPCNSPVIISLKEVLILYEDGQEKLEPYQTNALYQFNDLFVFETSDPQICFNIKCEKNIKKVVFRLKYLYFGNQGTLLNDDLIKKLNQYLLEINGLKLDFKTTLDAIKEEKDLLQVLLNESIEKLLNIERELEAKQSLLNYKENEICQILNSTSWKITRPLRNIGELLKKILQIPKESKKIAFLAKKAVVVIKRDGIKSSFIKIKDYLSHSSPYKSIDPEKYEIAIKRDNLNDGRVERIHAHINELSYQPLISIILPVYNVEERWLRKCIESVEAQLYSNWELCIADDASTKAHVKHVLDQYAAKDPRIKVTYRKKNGHISAASNTALDMALGDFIALLDNDDELTPDALYENVVLLNKYPDADMIYSDEDKINEKGERSLPFFKPDWSPDLLYSQMYTCHLGLYRTELVRRIGGFRIGFEGSQDYDLVLRISEHTERIYHIPKVLYSWRALETSTSSNPESKPYANDAGLRALNEHLSRVYGEGNAWAVEDKQLYVYDVRYKLPEKKPKVSIIIPTKDKVELIDACIKSIFSKTTYTNFEVIIMNNNSAHDETMAWFDNIQKLYKNIRVINANYEFNWSKLNNHGIAEASGDVFVFLNNDTIVISEDWLERLTEKFMRKNVGTVGGLLLYEDGSIQHAGVVIGLGGWAEHVFKGMNPIHFGSPFVSPVITRNVSASTGACLAISREVIEKIGKFNEEFVVCGSDVEISLRALKMGLVNIYDPHVKLYHLESKTRSNYIPEIDFTLSAKHYSPFRENGDPYYNPNLSLLNTMPSIKVGDTNA